MVRPESRSPWSQAGQAVSDGVVAGVLRRGLAARRMAAAAGLAGLDERQSEVARDLAGQRVRLAVLGQRAARVERRGRQPGRPRRRRAAGSPLSSMPLTILARRARRADHVFGDVAPGGHADAERHVVDARAARQALVGHLSGRALSAQRTPPCARCSARTAAIISLTGTSMGQASVQARHSLQRQTSSASRRLSTSPARISRTMRRGPCWRSKPLGQAATHWPHW